MKQQKKEKSQGEESRQVYQAKGPEQVCIEKSPTEKGQVFAGFTDQVGSVI